MADDIEQLRARIQVLEDHRELLQIFAAFGPYNDSAPGEEIAAFYTQDGEYHTDVPGAAPAIGAEAIAALFNSEMHKSAVEEGASHFTGVPHIVVDGDHAEIFFPTVMFRRSAGQWIVGRAASNRVWCVRSAQGWRIEHRENRALGQKEARRLFHDGAIDTPWKQTPVGKPPRKT
jgi:hypothetical protein